MQCLLGGEAYRRDLASASPCEAVDRPAFPLVASLARCALATAAPPSVRFSCFCWLFTTSKYVSTLPFHSLPDPFVPVGFRR